MRRFREHASRLSYQWPTASLEAGNVDGVFCVNDGGRIAVKKSRAGWRVATVGTEMLVGLAGGFFLGRYLDHRLGTQPWLMVTGVLLGFVAGLWMAYRAAQGP
ncbi:MAG: AtpZ/AtpI family protein [Firmicutes bacterium]|nr:AtpZ/AtpI family protein [Alicyclobacillaceae bacterium]MCL6497692.1 AtpZ/AtpI family protein [Bacillota bacterium]